ncbi:MAG TPA: PEP-CTERM sorting domain-containing protein, partial [Verrucomicrobiales bacterium]|nr:PEP-CTERM sorting domain-containing protein [Verrucomicrobiales bacterium]
TLGTPYAHAGQATFVNDLGTAPVDTWNGDQATNATAHVSYVGITFATPRTDFVGSLTLGSATFFDGGWFGPNNSGPGASQPLNASFIIPPVVQVTFNGGATWSTVPSTSNYSTVMSGVTLPVAFGAPTLSTSTFTITTPVTGINGIRLIGSEGGTASGGFMGVTELGVDAQAVPEPGSIALLGAASVLFSRRRRNAR